MEDSNGRWKRGGAPRSGGRGGASHQRGRGGRNHNDKGNKRKDLGRQAYYRDSKQQLDRRDRNDAENAKRQRLDEEGTYAQPDEFSMDFSDLFTKEEIEDEEKRPKRKVAVMVGYSGTGYKGMQFVPGQPTIERDLFRAFILAGAISKANANDPKKSSFVRCARTDKGVHAAGNMISLKLVVDEEHVEQTVEKINSHLPEQIRVWGIERTIGSFSCYQACDSRWYEYLIPTHSFLPPHPSSYLARRLHELADEAGDLENVLSRQEEVSDWWKLAESQYIQPVLDSLYDDVREHLQKAMYQLDAIGPSSDAILDESDNESVANEDNNHAEAAPETGAAESIASDSVEQKHGPGFAARLESATKRVRSAYHLAKSSYRLTPERLDRIREAFAQYQGTLNFHNYTIRKQAADPSAKRHIKSFAPFRTPSSTNETGTFIINDTEWLSVKVHGQSFMMHQIRKMVGMAALVVRTGCAPSRIKESLSSQVAIAVPKAPALGLLLEQPVFESYNTQRAAKFGREALSFAKYEKEMGDFKEKHIYQRIYAEEDKDHVFHTFFAQIDNFKNPSFLYLSSKGIMDVPGSFRDVAGGAGPRRVETKRTASGIVVKKRGGDGDGDGSKRDGGADRGRGGSAAEVLGEGEAATAEGGAVPDGIAPAIDCDGLIDDTATNASAAAADAEMDVVAKDKE